MPKVLYIFQKFQKMDFLAKELLVLIFIIAANFQYILQELNFIGIDYEK